MIWAFLTGCMLTMTLDMLATNRATWPFYAMLTIMSGVVWLIEFIMGSDAKKEE